MSKQKHAKQYNESKPYYFKKDVCELLNLPYGKLHVCSVVINKFKTLLNDNDVQTEEFIRKSISTFTQRHEDIDIKHNEFLKIYIALTIETISGPYDHTFPIIEDIPVSEIELYL